MPVPFMFFSCVSLTTEQSEVQPPRMGWVIAQSCHFDTSCYSSKLHMEFAFEGILHPWMFKQKNLIFTLLTS